MKLANFKLGRILVYEIEFRTWLGHICLLEHAGICLILAIMDEPDVRFVLFLLWLHVANGCSGNRK